MRWSVHTHALARLPTAYSQADKQTLQLLPMASSPVGLNGAQLVTFTKVPGAGGAHHTDDVNVTQDHGCMLTNVSLTSSALQKH